MESYRPKLIEGTKYDVKYEFAGVTPFGNVLVQRGVRNELEIQAAQVVDDYTAPTSTKFQNPIISCVIITTDENECPATGCIDDVVDTTAKKYVLVSGENWTTFDLWKFYLTHHNLSALAAQNIESSIQSHISDDDGVYLRELQYERRDDEISKMQITISAMTGTNDHAEFGRVNDTSDEAISYRERLDYHLDFHTQTTRPHITFFNRDWRNPNLMPAYDAMLTCISNYFQARGYRLPHSGKVTCETYSMSTSKIFERRIWQQKAEQGLAKLVEIGDNLRWQLL